MRLAFWRAGKDKAVVERAVSKRQGRSQDRPKPRAEIEAKPAPVAAKQASGRIRRHRSCTRSARRSRASAAGSSCRRCWRSSRPIAAVNLVTPRYKSEARILIDGRENVFLRPNGERNEERQRARSRGGDQPGAARAVARSRARDHQEEQARGAARIRSGAARRFAAEVAAGAGRHRPRSVLDDAGRAGARCLFRAAARPMPSTSRA